MMWPKTGQQLWWYVRREHPLKQESSVKTLRGCRTGGRNGKGGQGWGWGQEGSSSPVDGDQQEGTGAGRPGACEGATADGAAMSPTFRPPCSWSRVNAASAQRGRFMTIPVSLGTTFLFPFFPPNLCQASLSFTLSQSLLKLVSMESVMPSNHLILCRPLLLLLSIFPSIRVFPSESALRIRWPNYWSFSFSMQIFSQG